MEADQSFDEEEDDEDEEEEEDVKTSKKRAASSPAAKSQVCFTPLEVSVLNCLSRVTLTHI